MTRSVSLLAAIACALTLSACGTTPPAKPPVVAVPPTMEEMMSKAAQAASSGSNEAALGLWQQAATAFPADKQPWVRMAQTRYEAGQYGEAILNAQEVLVRDPADKLANSVIAISGLRLSTRALADLSRQNNLSGPLRAESQDLAKLLRESLGESVLVPPPEKAPARPPRKQPSKRTADEGSANPFNALK
ncbi:hypothetical protein [Janthinobacterium sp.]|uniref:hypothetical protein n=1 Tax=Janthinobacterium sp. TaxID=1871054 RepID=UPI00258E9D88|nr:hypothetical protein [Janthinobacterium sp.]MCX7290812.1 hypothetical protein [Janthinobacterium sp.]